MFHKIGQGEGWHIERPFWRFYLKTKKVQQAITWPKKGVGVSTDDNVDLFNLLGHLHVQAVAGMAESNQDLHSLLSLQALSLSLNTVKLIRSKTIEV